MAEWLPEGHLALFISDVVDQLDLKDIHIVYEQGDGRGQPPYHPVMMVNFDLCLLYRQALLPEDRESDVGGCSLSGISGGAAA